MKTLQNLAAGVFIFCVTVLSIISVLGVWDFFAADVIWKSFETIGVLALVAVIMIVAGQFMGDPAATPVAAPSGNFKRVRDLTLVVLIVSAALLALFGVLAIWKVIDDTAVLWKSLSSVAILAFSSLIIVMVCLEREQNPLWQKRAGQMSGGLVLGGILLAWLLAATFQ